MKKLFLIFAMFICSAIFSQERKIGEILQNCMYESLPDKGLSIYMHFKPFEKHLIEKRILKDSSATSYYVLFKNMVSEKDFDVDYDYSFIDSITKNHKDYMTYLLRNFDCFEKIKELPNYKSSKFYKREYSSFKILDFSEDDFKLEFYRLRILLALKKFKMLTNLRKVMAIEIEKE